MRRYAETRYQLGNGWGSPDFDGIRTTVDGDGYLVCAYWNGSEFVRLAYEDLGADLLRLDE